MVTAAVARLFTTALARTLARAFATARTSARTTFAGALAGSFASFLAIAIAVAAAAVGLRRLGRSQNKPHHGQGRNNKIPPNLEKVTPVHFLGRLFGICLFFGFRFSLQAIPHCAEDCSKVSASHRSITNLRAGFAATARASGIAPATLPLAVPHAVALAAFDAVIGA